MKQHWSQCKLASEHIAVILAAWMGCIQITAAMSGTARFLPKWTRADEMSQSLHEASVPSARSHG